MDWLIVICFMLQAMIFSFMIGFYRQYTRDQVDNKQWQKDHETWQFEQLYKINNKVLKPLEKEEKIYPVPASVSYLEDDPMAEFRGEVDDYS